MWLNLPMLMLLFRVGEEPWAIAVSEVREVVPLVALQAMSQGWSDGDSSGETALAGLMNYHGKTIPVVDVSVLANGPATKQNLNTRIVVVEASDLLERSLDHAFDADGSATDSQRRRVGLILASVSETTQLEPVANSPLVSRYVQSTWQLADGQLTANSDVVYQLAIDPVVAWVYQKTDSASDGFS